MWPLKAQLRHGWAFREGPLLYRGPCQALACDLVLFPFTLRLMTAHGTLLLFEVGAEPPHAGMRRMGRYNLTSALAADQRRIGGPYELLPPVVPVGTSFRRSRSVISLPAISPPPVQATAGTAALCLLQRNSLPSTHIRCRTTARRRATATMARRIPRRRATHMPHAFSHDQFPTLDKH
jgi:hypothetical protein